MQSKAATVAAYLKSLPDDRRKALQAIRKVVNDNLDPKVEEASAFISCIPIINNGMKCVRERVRRPGRARLTSTSNAFVPFVEALKH